MTPPGLVIFDCDGVLVDSERLSHAVLQQMLKEYGTELSLQQTFDHFMGTSTEKCLSVLASVIGKPSPPDFLSQFRDRTFEAFRTALTPVPGIIEVIASLTQQSCVASNGPHEKMRFTLRHTGLLPHFEGRVFSAEDVQCPKPAPDLFLHAAASLNVSAGSCIVVEDSPTGVAAAKAAGMLVFGFAAMGQEAKLLAAGANSVFQSMSELPHLIHGARVAA